MGKIAQAASYAAFLLLFTLLTGCAAQTPSSLPTVPNESAPPQPPQEPPPAGQPAPAELPATAEQPPAPAERHVWPPEVPPVQVEGAKSYLNITYWSVNGTPLVMDIHVPENGTGPYPTIIYVHGGAWAGGTREGCPYGFIAKGYALACIEYRLSWMAKFPAQIHDVKASVRWLRANAGTYGLDKDHFAAWGDSAGGHLVALLGTSGGVPELEGDEGNPQHSSRVQAVVDFFGPTDFVQVENLTERDDFYGYASAASTLIGGTLNENRDKAVAASPLTYITADDPPFLILHADRDDTVPLNQSMILHDGLLSAGVDSTLIIVPSPPDCEKGMHCFPQDPANEAAVEEFLDSHLLPPETSGQ